MRVKNLTFTACIILSFAPTSVQTKELHVFNDSVRKVYNTTICNFIERYVNECLNWDKPNYPLFEKMIDDRVALLEGDINSFLTLSDTCRFSLTRYENKFYEAAWSDTDKTVRMIFPIKYELILGKTKKQLEQELETHILHSIDTSTTILPTLQSQSDSMEFHSVPEQHYQITELTNTTYFKKEGNDYCLILDTLKTGLSLRNILLIPSEYNPNINVIQQIYGFKQTEYIVTLWQWLAYCKNANISLYVAVKEDEKEYKVTVIAENKDLAYNHLIKFIVPNDFITNQNKIWHMQITAYIPTHNLKNMYQQ